MVFRTSRPPSWRGVGALTLAWAACLHGCSSGTSAVADSVQALRASQVSPPAPTNPRFGYLRTVVNDRVLYLVLGYADPTPQGTLQTWYSGQGEVVKLLQGRVVATAGLPVDWRQVHADQAPSWQALLNAPAASGNGAPAATYPRQRDVMPGYRFGVQETVNVVAIPAPTPSAFEGAAPGPLQWFEETAPGSDLPAAQFAVHAQGDSANVVFSRQCLSATLCLSFQPWVPPAPTPAPSVPAAPR